MTHWTQSLRTVWLAAAGAAALAALAAGQADRPPASAPASGPSSRPAGLIELKHLRLDRSKRQITLDAEVCFNPGPLEVLLCKEGTKDYESVLRTKARPSDVHAALLALGLTPGRPARMSRATTQPAQFLPPDGPRLSIALRWKDGSGKAQQADPLSWLIRLGKGAPPLPGYWIFVGSEVFPDGGYWADQDGDIVSLANFPSAVIDVPFESSADNSALEFAGEANVIPPKGTSVQVVLTALPAAERAAAARVVMDIDPWGRYWIDGKEYTEDELSDWADQYIQRHSEGEVVLRPSGLARIQDVERARDRLRFGGLADIQEQRLTAPGPAIPMTAKQAALAVNKWRRVLAESNRMITDPAAELQDHLAQVQQELDDLERRKTLLKEYQMHLEAALKDHRAASQPSPRGQDLPPARD